MNTIYNPLDHKTFPPGVKLTPSSFFNLLGPYAQQVEKATAAQGKRIPASFTLAQAAVESAWGGSVLSRFAKNYFGIKKYPLWTGDTLTIPTHEVQGGKTILITAEFCAYSNIGDGLQGHADFLIENGRYAPAFQTATPEAFTEAIAAAGYATDPHYASTINALMHQYSLKSYDQPR